MVASANCIVNKKSSQVGLDHTIPTNNAIMTKSIPSVPNPNTNRPKIFRGLHAHMNRYR